MTFPLLRPWGAAAEALITLGREVPGLMQRAMRENARSFHVLAWYLMDRAPCSIATIGAVATANHMCRAHAKALLAELVGAESASLLWPVLKRLNKTSSVLQLEHYQSLDRWTRSNSQIAKLLQSLNPVSREAIELMGRLEEIPLAMHAFKCLRDDDEVDALLTVLDALIQLGSVSDDTQTRKSLLAMKTKSQLDRWIFSKVDLLQAPVIINIPAGVPLFQLSRVRDLRTAAKTFRNCLSLPKYLLGLINGDLFFIWRGSSDPIIGHAYKFSARLFALGQCKHVANEPVTARDIEDIKLALLRCGISLVRGPVGDALSKFAPD